MKTYHEFFKLYTPKLKSLGIENSAFHLLVSATLKEFDLDYYMVLSKEVNPEIIIELEKRIKRLLWGEPVQYILGYAFFYGLKIMVDNRVLIPRFDSEIIVERIIQDYRFKELVLVDVGTGSGAIALALKKESPNFKIYAIDNDKKALEVAKQNKLNLGLDIELIEGDLLTPLIMSNLKVDLIVSNPPYIDRDDIKVSEQVKKYEPSNAIFSDNQGLAHLFKIIDQAPRILNPNGAIYLEIGFSQAVAIKKYVEASGLVFGEISIIKDLSGNDRIVKIKLR
jgi:release factor glutamine methyltransferase